MPSSSEIKLTDYNGFKSGSLEAYVSPWGKGNLVQGQDYDENISFDPSTFPNNVVLTSDWNLNTSTSVFGFNAIDFGDYDNTVNLEQKLIQPAQIKDISTLSETHSFTTAGDVSGFDVIDDLFLTSMPGSSSKVSAEIEVFQHTPPSSVWWMANQLRQVGTVSVNGVSWTVAKSGSSSPDIAFMPSQGQDISSGTTDIKSMLDYLTTTNILTGNEYFNGMAFGEETSAGNGSVIISSLSFDFMSLVRTKHRVHLLPQNDPVGNEVTVGGSSKVPAQTSSGTSAVSAATQTTIALSADQPSPASNTDAGAAGGTLSGPTLSGRASIASASQDGAVSSPVESGHVGNTNVISTSNQSDMSDLNSSHSSPNINTSSEIQMSPDIVPDGTRTQDAISEIETIAGRMSSILNHSAIDHACKEMNALLAYSGGVLGPGAGFDDVASNTLSYLNDHSFNLAKTLLEGVVSGHDEAGLL